MSPSTSGVWGDKRERRALVNEASDPHRAPEGITGLAAHQLCQILDGPTLIHLRGKCEPPLFLCVLLHGNEIGGWDGAQNVRIIRQDCLCYLMERVENGV